jgi:hypothetical protein
MATKTKTVVEKAAKKRAKDACPQGVVITGAGVSEPITYLDPAGNKHHAKVFWQALDLNKQYQIALDTPPLPFTNGDGPFATDPNTGGRTTTLTVDTHLQPGSTVYTYTVQELVRGRWSRHGGGGIIIDS